MYLDTVALRDSRAIVPVTLRAVYAKPQYLGTPPVPYAESWTRAQLDCSAKRAHVSELGLHASDGAPIASLPIDSTEAEWQAFDQHPLSTYFLAACIRMGRIRGRLAPN